MDALPRTADFVRDCDALIVVPPFSTLARPSLAAHLLQAAARRRGFDVAVLYANLLLAAAIGPQRTLRVTRSTIPLVGERLFARRAWGAAPLGEGREPFDSLVPPDELAFFAELEAELDAWVETLAGTIASAAIPVLGATTSYQQTAASLALLGQVKRLRPATAVVLGGANCAGELARGLLELAPFLDAVFSGESDAAFPEWLAARRDGKAARGAIDPEPIANLDELATPDYADFHAQQAATGLREAIPEPARDWLPYEASRGCFWGEHRQCLFCGIPSSRMQTRRKSDERVIGELALLLRQHRSPRVYFVDSVLPHGATESLLPRLAREVPGLHAFVECRTHLSLKQVRAMRAAGVRVVQAGLEALDDELLVLLRKGVRARDNIAFLRAARMTGIRVGWNLLHGIPGDRSEQHERTLRLMPWLRHLEPPVRLQPIHLDRFSPYLESPELHGLTALRPAEEYRLLFARAGDAARLAHRFEADFASGSRERPDLIERLADEVGRWLRAWAGGAESAPRLHVIERGPGRCGLIDTRGVHPSGRASLELDEEEATLALFGARIGADDEGEAIATGSRARDRCVELGLALPMGRFLVPLATADPPLLERLEARHGRPAVNSDEARS